MHSITFEHSEDNTSTSKQINLKKFKPARRLVQQSARREL